MAKISDQARNLLSLVERSEDIGQGWRQVSDVLWPHVRRWASEASDLFELRTDQHIRLTPEGVTVLKWML